MTTTIKKADAVRQAIQSGKTNPRDGSLFVWEQFGISMQPSTFSTYKSQIRRGLLRPVGDSAASPSSTDELARKVKELANVYGLDAIQQVVSIASFWKQ